MEADQSTASLLREAAEALALAREPLTVEQIKDCLDAADQMYCERDGDKEVFKARAIEAAHGIKDTK